MMKIKSRREEIYDLILLNDHISLKFMAYLGFILLLINELMLEKINKQDFLLLFLIFILFTIAAIRNFIKKYLYLSRTFILDENGCTIILGKYHKTYAWTKLYVQYCEMPLGRDDRFAQFPGSGILISTKPITQSPPEGPLSYSVKKHPVSSVFFRFTLKDTHQNKVPPVYKKGTTFHGYMVEKEPLLQILSNTNVVKRYYGG